MELYLYAALFLPLVSFFILAATAKKISRTTTGYIGCASILFSFLCFSGLLYYYNHTGSSPVTFTLFSWIPVDKINADFALRLDPLSLLMCLIITGVGFLIHVYSNGYMDHDEDYARYFAFLNFFVFAMLLLVLAANLLLLFVGWEGVGLASYFLIGFWYTRPSAAQAATKAFVVNRIGDCGFLIGLLFTFYIFGTSDIEAISQKAQAQFSLDSTTLILLTLLLFIGAVGKSAQLPLHVWLPDAMEGPTPVSALIHAATMVTAGVYLVVRMHAVFMLAPSTLHLIGAIGGITSLFAALCAVGQTDLKRVLAYSTVSQLGLMFLACGVGAFYAAMFHLTTHAFVKGLLFLSAGNVVHMLHDTTDMRQMGGLSKVFTKTHWLFLIGVLALSGIPPLSAFFSKELILEQEHLAGFETLFYVGLAASILTAFYLTRAYCLTFLGKPNDGNQPAHPHEAPKIMLIPVGVLALLSLGGGFLGFTFGRMPILEGFLAEVGVNLFSNKPSDGFLFTPETLMAILGGLFGVGLSAYIYTRAGDRFRPAIPLLKNAFYVDQIYDWLFVRPLETLSKWIGYFIEPKIFEGLVVAATDATQGTSHYFQKVQSGQIRSYVAWMVIGTVLLISFMVL